MKVPESNVDAHPVKIELHTEDELKESKLTESEQKMETEKKEKNNNITIVGCEVCNDKDDVRIILRQCGHVVCLSCLLEYIKNRIIVDGHPRFKCPVSACNSVIHENDINAVLDEKEPALEKYMSIVHRRYLQHKQYKHSIMAALPSSDIKRCPLCRSVYMHEPGCNYVICANSACNTAFCWQCEKPVGRPCSHFTTASTCRLGYKDYERIFRSVQLALDVNFIILWILLPFVYLIAFLYIPIVTIFLVPASLAYDAYRKERDSHDFLVPIDVITIIFRIIIGIVIGIVVSIPFAIGSIVSGFLIVFFYMGFLFIRTVPCGLSGDRVGTILCFMRWAGRIFKIGPYGKLLEEARRERRDALVKLETNQDDFENALSESDGTSGPVESSSATQQGTSSVFTTNTKTDEKTMSARNNWPELSFEVDKTSARGWITAVDQPELLQDVTREAIIELSSVAHCGGVDQLLHDSSDFAWRTNMSPPHQATVTFSKKTDICYLMLYLDYKTDESYCPQEVRVDLGWGTNDWWHRIHRRVNYPKGWVKIRLADRFDTPRRVMALRMTVMKNHEKGRDCVIRHFRIIGPQYHRHDSINRLILGPTGGLAGVTQERQARSHIMNDHLTVR